MKTVRARIDEIRFDIEENHWQCIAPFIGGRGGLGETFCGHIHELNMTFKDLAEHYGITLFELADVTADHIRRLDGGMVCTKLVRYQKEYDMERSEAKAQILELYQKEIQLDYFGIMEHLDIDLELIVELCNELVDDGKLEGVA